MTKRLEFLLVYIVLGPTGIFSQTTLDAPTQPFNFDTLRKTPSQSRSSLFHGTKEGRDLHEKLVAGYAGREVSFSQKATGLFPQQEEDFVQEEEPVLSRKQTADQIAQQRLGTDSKGRVDPLAKAQLKTDLGLDSLSESDYELFFSDWRSHQDPNLAKNETLLNPMPTLINSKTGGPPHAYSVSQAGLGSRAKPRSGDNPFGDWIQFFQLDQPITRGTDTWDRRVKPAESATSEAATPATNQTGETANP